MIYKQLMYAHVKIFWNMKGWTDNLPIRIFAQVMYLNYSESSLNDPNKSTGNLDKTRSSIVFYLYPKQRCCFFFFFQDFLIQNNIISLKPSADSSNQQLTCIQLAIWAFNRVVDRIGCSKYVLNMKFQ